MSYMRVGVIGLGYQDYWKYLDFVLIKPEVSIKTARRYRSLKVREFLVEATPDNLEYARKIARILRGKLVCEILTQDECVHPRLINKVHMRHYDFHAIKRVIEKNGHPYLAFTGPVAIRAALTSLLFLKGKRDVMIGRDY